MEKLKRKLIASFIYDLGKSETSIYSPCVNVYWDIEDENIKIFVRCAWQDFTMTIDFYRFKTVLKKLSMTDIPKHDITERTSYKGDFEIEESYHLSDFGKSVLTAKTKEQVISWINSSSQF
jgi:hypothetical protein